MPGIPRHRPLASAITHAHSVAAVAALTTALALGCALGCQGGSQGASAGEPDSSSSDGGGGTDASVEGAPAGDPDGGPTASADSAASGPCGGTFVFCDDYTRASLASAYATYHGTWTRGSSSYAVTDETAWERARSTLAPSVSSFDVTVQGSTVGDSGLGIVYGGSASADDGYAVLVHPAQFQGVYLKQLVPGQADVAIANAALPAGLAGKPLTLRVARSGTQVTVWLNGTQVLQSSDSATTLQGRLGLLLSDTNLPTTDAGGPAGATFTLLRVDSESSATGDGGAAGDGGPPPAPGSIDYMIGYGGGSTSNATIATAESTFGRPMDMVTEGVTVDGYQDGPYSSGNGRALGKVAVFEMLSMPWDTNQGLTDMAQAASGAYDSVYTQMAQNLASSGMPVISARPGHEMNGDWYPWSAVTGNTHNATPANYIATFRRIAQIIRKYNPNTSIEWCAALQTAPIQWSDSIYTPLDYWVGAYDPVTNPGGADLISMDFYEGDQGSNFTTDVVGVTFGLSWLSSFAQQNGVPIAFSEAATGLPNSNGQGTGCPCSNDGTFMQNLIDWLNGQPSGLVHFFVFSPWEPADDLMASGNAAIQQVWVSSWGKTHFGGSWWKGPKVPSQP
jgi:hypothetical protein